MNSLDGVIETITKNKLFLLLKNVIENNDGWHDHEVTFSHSVKTSNIAKREIDADFISNKKAKSLFLKFVNEEVYGMPRKNLMILAALLHDCGKILSYRENRKVFPLAGRSPDNPKTTTFCPGHEYYGGLLVAKEILKNISISNDAKDYLARIVTLHGTFNAVPNYTSKKNWSEEDIVSEVKTRAEGYYVEALFNSYCDCYDAPAFSEAKEAIKKIFNNPDLYTKREYFIP